MPPGGCLAELPRRPHVPSSPIATARRYGQPRCAAASPPCAKRPASGCRPRLHDLRHAFAVHRLTAWYRQGADVQRLLPMLSVYMGHASLASTQVYLTVTPELLRAASLRFQQYACPTGGPDA